MTNWINNKFGLQLSEEDLTSVKDFTLMWNIYDNLIFQSNFTIANAENEYQNVDFEDNELEEIFNYFKNRYIDNGETKDRFDNLNFRPNDRGEFVRDVLLENDQEVENKALAITIIIYRFRNNLFHGLKDFRVIDEQKDNFDNANRFLKIVINKFQ